MAKKMTKVGLSLACVAALGAAQLAPVAVPVFGTTVVKAAEGDFKYFAIRDFANIGTPNEIRLPGDGMPLNPGESYKIEPKHYEGYEYVGVRLEEYSGAALDGYKYLGEEASDGVITFEEIGYENYYILREYKSIPKKSPEEGPTPPSPDEQPGQPTPPAPPSPDEQAGQPTPPAPPSPDEQPGQPTPPAPPSPDEQPGQPTPPAPPSADEQPGQPTPPAPPSADEQPGQPTSPTPAPKTDGAEAGKEAAKPSTNPTSAQAVPATQESEKATSSSSKTLPNTGDVTAEPLALAGLGLFLASLGLRHLKKERD